MLTAAIAAGNAAASPAFERCRPELEHDVECASVPVELDRRKIVPGTIALHVERIRAKAKPARGALFVLSGGPGEGASAGTGVYAAALAPALATHDLILVDQRGTGRSGALRCPRSFENARTRADFDREVAACGTALGSRLPFFTLSDVVDDLDAVRAEVGIERIDLVGVSYGTRVALAYAARYPQHVNRLVLDSVVPLAGAGGFGLNSIGAVPRVLTEVCGRGCSFTRDTTAELAELVRRLAARPLAGRVARGDGRLHRARMGRGDLLGLLLAGDYLPSLRAHFPAAVHSAVGGDPAPLLRLRELASSFSLGADPRVFSTALFLATSCAETTEPWVTAATTAERSAAARAFLEQLPAERLAPFDVDTALTASAVQYCRAWPQSGHATRFGEALPDVPTLLLAGTADLRTPLEDALAVAAQLPRAQLLPLRGAGHGVLFQGSQCIARAVERFLSDRSAGRCAALASAAPARPVPPLSRSVAVAEAMQITLRDVLGQLPLAIYTKSAWFTDDFVFFVRAGGLRGGRYSATLSGLTLERVTVVPGVTVSGRIKGLVNPFEGSVKLSQGELRVTASGRRHAVLRLERNRLTGVFGGRRVSWRLVLAP